MILTLEAQVISSRAALKLCFFSKMILHALPFPLWAPWLLRSPWPSSQLPGMWPVGQGRTTTRLASDVGTKSSLRNTAMCLPGPFCLVSLQVLLMAAGMLRVLKLLTFFPSKLFPAVPTNRGTAPQSGEVSNCETSPTTSFLVVHFIKSFKKYFIYLFLERRERRDRNI